MVRSALCAFLLAGTEALRKQSAKDLAVGAPGRVAGLYTFGAPKVSSPALTNPASEDGCFPGWRVVNKNDQWFDLTDDVDIVPALLGHVSGYSHPNLVTQFLDQRGRSTFQDCGWVGSDRNSLRVRLHLIWHYVGRSVENDNLEVVAKIGLDHSYDANVERVAEAIAEHGWNLVSAVIGREVVHLMQNPRDDSCILTFGGSDTLEDWVKDALIILTNFCGLEQRVHTGFKLEYLQMVTDDAFQEHVRPQLGFCSKVEVMGHSLGGAVASLFTACAHNDVQPDAEGYDDHKWIAWTKQTSRTLPRLGVTSEKDLLKYTDQA